MTNAPPQVHTEEREGSSAEKEDDEEKEVDGADVTDRVGDCNRALNRLWPYRLISESVMYLPGMEETRSTCTNVNKRNARHLPSLH